MNYLIGQRFEHYQVEAFLGEGGMGSVYRARDLKHDRLVALKVMHAQLSQQAQFQQRFAQEAQAAANFNTPSIVKIHQHGTHEGIPFIVMEYISGGSLVSYLKQLRYSGNHLGLEEVIAMAAQVADGLGYAHQRGVIHRDIKPDNILLKLQREQPGIAGGAPRQAVITDFGLAILLKKGEDVATNPFMGSLPYMSPEQCLNQPLDGRSDIYSLGIMLYQLTTGQLPFKINAPADIIKHVEDPPLPPRLVNPDLPEAVETVILKTLAKKPGDRHQTGAELAHTLRQTALTAATSTASRSAMDHVVTQWVEQRWVAGVDVNNRVDVNQTWISEGDFRLFIAHQWEESRVEGMVKESFIIGRNPDNDIVLQDRGVSGQHAMIQRGETGWEVRDLGSTNGTFLGAKPLEYDKPIGWNSDETLHIGPYSLKWQLFKGGQRRPVSTVIPIAVTRDANGQTGGPGAPASALAAAAPVAAASLAPTGALVDAAPALDARSVSFTSDVLAVTITPQEMEVQPGVESFLQISVANYGLTVEDVSIRAETGGFFPSWMGFDRSEIKLMPDESQTVTLTLTPPQDSSLLAGEHHYAVIAATARSESVKAEGRIQVAKWEDFQLDMHPTNLQENVVGRVTINDRSNFDNIYNIAGLDDSDALIFAYEEPPQAIRTDIETQQQWLRMDAGAEGNASFTIEPKRRAWFGRDQLHSYEMRVRTETSEWQSLYGQVEIRPRISRRVMLFFILLLLLLGIGGYYGYREIQKRNQAELAAVTEELGNARATAEARAAEAESNSAAAVATREAADAALADAIASGSSASEIATREAEALAAGEAEAIAAATATAAAAEAAAADAAAADAAAAEATSAASSPAAVATPTPANAPPTNIVLSVTTIDEDSPIGTVVGVFTTIDPDGAALPSERDPLLASHDKSPIRFKILLQSGSYTYSLVAGSGDNDNSAFTISGDQLLTAKLLDFETQGRYNIRVQTDDGNNGIFEQPIVITVVDKNDPPTFTSQPIVTGRQDVPYSYSILINDPDASDTPVVTASTLPSWLTLTDNGDGTATLAGTPTNDEVGNHDVTLEVTDSGGEKDSQTFVLEIVNINDPPRFSSSPPTDATQDTLYNYNVITTVDPDANDTLTISSAPLPLPAWLTLTDNGDGTAELAGTPANADVGNHNVTLQVADAATATDTQTFTIIVANVNDAPVFTSTPVTDATQDIPYNYTVTTSDPDSIFGDTRSISVVSPSLPNWLNFVDNNDGTATLSGTPLNADVFVPPFDIVIQVVDIATASDDQSFRIDIANVNDAPTAGDDAITVDEDAIATSLASGAGNTVLGNDTDIDPPGGGNILSVNTTPTTAPNHGTLTLFADGTFSYDHDGSENFSDSFVYEVCDDGSPQLCDTATVNITINPLNDPPVNTVPQSTQNTNEDTDLVINGVSVSDDDIGSGDMEVTLTAANGVLSLNVTTRLSFSAGNGTDDATMTFTGQIGDVNTALAAITYSPTQDYNFDTNSSTTTIVLITDDQDATNAQLDTDTITINVAAINDEPEFDPISNLTLPENTTSHAVTITGVGPGGGSDEASQNLSWSVVSGDASLVSIPSNPISGSGMTRTLTIGPLGAALVGTTNITVTLTDSGGTANPSDDDTLVDVFQLTVTAVNDPPVFNAISNPASTAEGNMSPPTVSITGVGPGGGADEAGQCVDVSATSSDTNIVPHPTISSSGCVTGASTRTLTYVPANPDAFGNVTITVTAQDNGGTSNPGDDDTTTSTFQVTITNVNDPPTFNNISNQPSVAEDSGTTIISITGVDPGGGVYESSQTVSFSATSSNTSIIPNPLVTGTGPTRSLSLAPAANKNGGPVTITVIANDNSGGNQTFQDTFQISVTAINDEPIFDLIANQTVNEDSGAGTVSITGVAAGPAAATDELASQTVNFTATSDDTSIIGTPSFTGSGATRTLNFTPKADAFGTVNITVTAQDTGGTANPGDDDTFTDTFQITVNNVQDLPKVGDISFTVPEDNTINFSQATFDAAFSDIDGDSLSKIQVTSLPANGTLRLSGVAVTVNQEISAGSLGNLAFVPTLDWNGNTSFGWNGHDGIAYAAAGALVYITITPVNDPPVLGSIGGSVTFTTGGTPVILDNNGTIVDPDSLNFDTGVLTIEITPNIDNQDRILVLPSPVIVVIGSSVYHFGVFIGTCAQTSCIATANPPSLTITLNGNANILRTRELMQRIAFDNTGPANTTARTVRFTLTDGDGGTSNQPTVTANVQ